MTSKGSTPAVRLALAEWRLLQSRRRLVREQKRRALRMIANLSPEEYNEYMLLRAAEEAPELASKED